MYDYNNDLCFLKNLHTMYSVLMHGICRESSCSQAGVMEEKLNCSVRPASGDMAQKESS